MRRGLMAWDAQELPLDTLKARVARLQSAMAEEGQDAILLYTNFIRSGAVSHLTAFSPYWADGILMVPKSGEPIFATTLSNRVASWIQSVKPVGELVCTPKPGVTLAERLTAMGEVARVAILELDAFPGGVYDEFAGALPGVEIVDGSASFARARAELDEVELHLLSRADAIAAKALTRTDPDQADAAALVGAAEALSRLDGAEESYVAIAPDLDADTRFRRVASAGPLGGRFALRMTVAYKGSWVRRTRTFARDAADRGAIEAADAWFGTLAAKLDPKQPLGVQITKALADLPGATLQDWLAESVVGTRPLSPLASSKEEPGSLAVPALVLTLNLKLDGNAWNGACLAGLGTS